LLKLQTPVTSTPVLYNIDFLHGGKYVGEVFYFSRRRSGIVRGILLCVNLSMFIFSFITAIRIITNPSLAYGEAGFSSPRIIYIEWAGK
jgi:hypothetical protein